MENEIDFLREINKWDKELEEFMKSAEKKGGEKAQCARQIRMEPICWSVVETKADSPVDKTMEVG